MLGEVVGDIHLVVKQAVLLVHFLGLGVVEGKCTEILGLFGLHAQGYVFGFALRGGDAERIGEILLTAEAFGDGIIHIGDVQFAHTVEGVGLDFVVLGVETYHIP